MFDCRPVSVDVSGIDMRTVRPAKLPAEPVVAPAEREQKFGGPILLDHIDPELEVLRSWTPERTVKTSCRHRMVHRWSSAP